jgi:ribosomal-protein-alanine N-acetyltransferase
MDLGQTQDISNETVGSVGPLPFVIRKMQKRDIPAVMSIERVSFPSPWPESAYHYELSFRKDSCFYVLQLHQDKDKGYSSWKDRLFGLPGERPAILGYYGVRFPSRRAHLCTLAIHPNWRGRGLGQYALMCALDEALQHEVDAVTLEVRTSNTIALQIYAKVGFVRNSLRRAYYRDGEDAWVMTLGPIDQQVIAHLNELRRTLENRLLNEALVNTGR